MGVEYHRAGRFKEAESVYRLILSADPHHPDALNLLGLLAVDAGHTQAGVELYQRAIRVRPDSGSYQLNLGHALRRAGRDFEAIETLQRAAGLMPDSAEAHNELAAALGQTGELDRAQKCIERALSIRPNFAEAYNNLGSLHHRAIRLEESIASLRKAIELKPDLHQAHVNLGMVLLLLGDFEAGWAEHEWRLQSAQMRAMHRHFARPIWNGEPLDGKIILLYSEQGLGDAIQFARYVPIVASHGGRVVLLCRPSLVSLFKTIPGIDQVITEGSPLPNFDVHCPLLSLPKALKTTPANIPASVPYFQSDGAKGAEWKTRLNAIAAGRPKVGLVWAGNPEHSNERNRSTTFETYRPLVDIPNIAWFCLQLGPAAEQASEARAQSIVHDLSPQLHDFSDTAAAVAALDLLITVDTAPAHLAGSLAVPVWVMLPLLPDWRWQLDRDDSPWYPTMRLFRQQLAGDWKRPVGLMREILIERTEGANP